MASIGRMSFRIVAVATDFIAGTTAAKNQIRGLSLAWLGLRNIWAGVGQAAAGVRSFISQIAAASLLAGRGFQLIGQGGSLLARGLFTLLSSLIDVPAAAARARAGFALLADVFARLGGPRLLAGLRAAFALVASGAGGGASPYVATFRLLSPLVAAATGRVVAFGSAVGRAAASGLATLGRAAASVGRELLITLGSAAWLPILLGVHLANVGLAELSRGFSYVRSVAAAALSPVVAGLAAAGRLGGRLVTALAPVGRVVLDVAKGVGLILSALIPVGFQAGIAARGLSLLAQGWQLVKAGGAALLGSLGGIGTAFGNLFSTLRSAFGTIAQGFGDFLKGIAEAVPVVGKLAAGLAGGMIGLGTAFVYATVRGAEHVTEMQRLANLYGFAYSEMTLLSEAARRQGVQLNSLTAWLDHYNYTLGAAAQGNRTAKAEFAKLGLDPQKLFQMKPDERTFATLEAMRRLPSEAERARAAYQLFGRSGVDALRIVNMSAKQWADLRKELNLEGRLLTPQQVAIAQQYTAVVNKLKSVWAGVLEQLAIKFGPLLIRLGEGLLRLLTEGEGVAGKVQTIYDWFVKIETVGLTIEYAFTHAAEIIENQWTAMLAALTQQLAKLAKAGSKLPDALGGKQFREAAQSLKELGDNAAAGAKMEDDLLKRNNFGAKFLRNHKKNAEEIAKVSKEIADSLAQANPDERNRLVAGMEAAGKYIAEAQPAYDQFAQTLNAINFLFDKGAMSEEMYGSAIGKLVSDLDKSVGIGHVRAPEAALKDTRESYSIAVNAFNNRPQTAEQRITQLLTEARMQDQLKVRFQREMAEALKKLAGGPLLPELH